MNDLQGKVWMTVCARIFRIAVARSWASVSELRVTSVRSAYNGISANIRIGLQTATNVAGVIVKRVMVHFRAFRGHQVEGEGICFG
jgi:hypothetical protein